jgi:hypothetical protein
MLSEPTLGSLRFTRATSGRVCLRHLLLGLVREGGGIGAGVLESLGVNLDRTLAEVLRVIASRDDPA